MKKKIFKHLAVILALVTIMSCVFSGCGKSGSSGSTGQTSGGSGSSGAAASGSEDKDSGSKVSDADAVVIKMLMPTTGNTEDLGIVQDEINKILVDKVGAKIDIMVTNMGSLAQQLNLMLTSEGDVDITYVQGANIRNYVRNGQLKDLTDYYNNATEEFRTIFPESYYEAGRIGGQIYSFPTNRNFSGGYYFMVNKKLADDMGLNLDKEDKTRKWSFDEVKELAQKAKEKYPDIYPIVPMNGSSFISTGWTWDGLGDNYNLGIVENCGQTTEVINIVDCKDFIDWCHTMRSWYQEGLIMEDCLSNTEYYATLFTANKAFGAFNFSGNPNYDPTDPELVSYQLMMVPEWIASSSVTNMSYAIAAGSKNPDKAWEVLQLLYTDDEIGNLLKYGIEGTHYELNEDGKVKYLDGQDVTTCKYTVGWTSPWYLPNWALGKLSYTQKDGHYEAFVEMDKNATASKLLGCIFDSSSVVNEYTACANVYDKYYKALICGSVDPDSTIAAFAEELEQAGIDKIIEVKQEQVNAFLEQ